MSVTFEPIEVRTLVDTKGLLPGQFAKSVKTGHLVLKFEEISIDEKTYPQDTVIDLVTGKRPFCRQDEFELLTNHKISITTDHLAVIGGDPCPTPKK